MAFTNLNKKIDQLNSTSRYRSAPTPKNKKKFFLRLFIILLIIVVVLYLPVRGVYSAAKQLSQSGKQISAAAKQNDLGAIKKGVDQARAASSKMNSSLTFLFWLRLIPFFGGYYIDAAHFARAASYELDGIKVLLNSLDPYKDELGLNGVATPGQDKVAQAVKILDKVIPELDKVEPDLQSASQEVSSVDTGKYPEVIAGRRLKSQIETAKNFITGTASLVKDNRQVIEVIPSALGASSPKTYLLLFQNDKELRPTGGFLTAYAFMKLDKGHLSATQSDDIYRLDEQLLGVCVNKVCNIRPPAPIVKYLPEADGKPRTTWSMRDSNLSPDLPTSLAEFERMYNLLNSKQAFDGIITIDTKVVEELIKITGPVEIDGIKYSAETDKRCNCPNVIYELERYAQVIEKGEKDRKAVLGVLMQQLLSRSLGASTEKLPEFINVGVTLANQKHIMMNMHDSKTQSALDKLGWTGRVLTPEGDYLHINDANFAGGKSNLYLDEKVNLEVNGEKHKLTLEYKNPQAFNVWLNGINRDYIRIYVPKGSKLIASKGSDETVATQQDDTLNKTYFEAFIQVRPQNSRTLSFEYTVPAAVAQKSLLIQKQPGTKDYSYTVTVNGKKHAFNLSSDQTLKF